MKRFISPKRPRILGGFIISTLKIHHLIWFMLVGKKIINQLIFSALCSFLFLRNHIRRKGFFKSTQSNSTCIRFNRSSVTNICFEKLFTSNSNLVQPGWRFLAQIYLQYSNIVSWSILLEKIGAFLRKSLFNSCFLINWEPWAAILYGLFEMVVYRELIGLFYILSIPIISFVFFNSVIQ